MNKIYFDKKTRLEWQVGPDKNTGRYEAKEWVDSLGDGWRFPTIKEYETIYKAGLGKRNIPPELETTGWYGWSIKKSCGGYAWYFSFLNGKELWGNRTDSNFSRGFAVRSCRRSRRRFDNLKAWFKNLKRKVL